MHNFFFFKWLNIHTITSFSLSALPAEVRVLIKLWRQLFCSRPSVHGTNIISRSDISLHDHELSWSFMKKGMVRPILNTTSRVTYRLNMRLYSRSLSSLINLLTTWIVYSGCDLNIPCEINNKRKRSWNLIKKPYSVEWVHSSSWLLKFIDWNFFFFFFFFFFA